MKELIFIKVPSALLSVSLTLYLISVGFSKYDIGIFNSIASLAAMISSFYFSYRALKEEDISSILSLSAFNLLISTLAFVYLKDFDYLLVSFFLFSFYYNAYLYLLKVHYSKISKNIKEVQSKFEFFGGIYYLLGLVIGIILSKFLTLKEIILFTSFWFFGALIPRIKGKRKKVLEVIDEVSEEVSRDVVSGMFSLRGFRISREIIFFHIGVFLWVFTNTLYGSQFQVFLKEVGYSNEWIFGIFFLGSFANAVFYKIARRFSYNLLVIFVAFDIIPLFMYFLGNKVLIPIAWFLDGITYGIQVVLIDSIFLEKFREDFGSNLLLRNVATILGSYICGILLSFISFKELFLISLALNLFFIPFFRI